MAEPVILPETAATGQLLTKLVVEVQKSGIQAGFTLHSPCTTAAIDSQGVKYTIKNVHMSAIGVRFCFLTFHGPPQLMPSRRARMFPKSSPFPACSARPRGYMGRRFERKDPPNAGHLSSQIRRAIL